MKFFSTHKQGRKIRLLVFILILLLLVPVTSVLAEEFPLYSCIESNVAFWKKVYSEYSLSQAIIHDVDNLSVIYEVVDLLPPESKGSQKINMARIKKVKDKYRQYLLVLAKGKQPSTTEGKRVKELWGPEAGHKEFRQAAENIRSQLGQKDRFRRGVIRSGSYLATIKDIFRSHGVPSDLAYLAHVESSFNPNAYSKFGAAGIWQFTQSTGKLFMSVDYTLDERRDPIRSSYAAARLLKQNYQKLGEWPLAITAYNHGASGMMRAKKAKGDYENIFREHNGPAFRFASRNFYSEFLAAREVAGNYQKYFGDLPLESPEQYREVKLDGFVPVKDLASHFKISVAEIKRYNPGLREPVFQGRKHVPKGYVLRLPGDRPDLGRLAAKIPATLYESSQQRSRFYRVQSGDTASLVARKHGVKLSELVLANQLGSKAMIFVGQNLRIPSAEEGVALLAKSYKHEVEGSLQLASVQPDKKPVAKAAVQVVPPVAQDSVKGIEEIEAMGLAGGTDQVSPEFTAAELQPLEIDMAVTHNDQVVEGFRGMELPRVSQASGENGGSDSIASVAEETAAPIMAQINPEVLVGNLQVESVTVKRGKTVGLIRVEAEETLGHYAAWLEVPTAEVRSYNGLTMDKMIRINQPLNIPLEKVGKEIFEERRYEFHKEMEEDFFAVYRIGEVNRYEVRKGDNIWRLCNETFELPLWLLRKYNPTADLGNLAVRQELLIPTTVRKDNEFAVNNEVLDAKPQTEIVVDAEVTFSSMLPDIATFIKKIFERHGNVISHEQSEAPNQS